MRLCSRFAEDTAKVHAVEQARDGSYRRLPPTNCQAPGWRPRRGQRWFSWTRNPSRLRSRGPSSRCRIATYIRCRRRCHTNLPKSPLEGDPEGPSFHENLPAGASLPLDGRMGLHVS